MFRYLNNGADFERQVGVFVLLSHLKTREMGEPEFHFVFVQKVFGNGALNCLAVLQLKNKTILINLCFLNTQKK